MFPFFLLNIHSLEKYVSGISSDMEQWSALMINTQSIHALRGSEPTTALQALSPFDRDRQNGYFKKKITEINMRRFRSPLT